MNDLHVSRGDGLLDTLICCDEIDWEVEGAK